MEEEDRLEDQDRKEEVVRGRGSGTGAGVFAPEGEGERGRQMQEGGTGGEVFGWDGDRGLDRYEVGGYFTGKGDTGDVAGGDGGREPDAFCVAFGGVRAGDASEGDSAQAEDRSAVPVRFPSGERASGGTGGEDTGDAGGAEGLLDVHVAMVVDGPDDGGVRDGPGFHVLVREGVRAGRGLFRDGAVDAGLSAERAGEAKEFDVDEMDEGGCSSGGVAGFPGGRDGEGADVGVLFREEVPEGGGCRAVRASSWFGKGGGADDAYATTWRSSWICGGGAAGRSGMGGGC